MLVVAAAPRALAVRPNVLDATSDVGDALADHLTVALELRLARTAGVDAATEARKLASDAGQTRQPVLQLGQLDLQPALVALGVFGEDVEDDRAAIDDSDVEPLLEILLLRRRELVVRHHEVEARPSLLRRDLDDFALAHIRSRIGPRAPLDRLAHDLRARGAHQRGELVQ